MTTKITAGTPVGRNHSDQPANQLLDTAERPAIRRSTAVAEKRRIGNGHTAMTYTVGSYLAARLSQIGLKHHFTVAGDYTLVLLD